MDSAAWRSTTLTCRSPILSALRVGKSGFGHPDTLESRVEYTEYSVHQVNCLNVVELISENASNLRTLIFGEFPNLHCENAPC
jgi:hypothetical protein